MHENVSLADIEAAISSEHSSLLATLPKHNSQRYYIPHLAEPLPGISLGQHQEDPDIHTLAVLACSKHGEHQVHIGATDPLNSMHVDIKDDGSVWPNAETSAPFRYVPRGGTGSQKETWEKKLGALTMYYLLLDKAAEVVNVNKSEFMLYLREALDDVQRNNEIQAAMQALGEQKLELQELQGKIEGFMDDAEEMIGLLNDMLAAVDWEVVN